VRELVLNLYSNAGAIQKEVTQKLSYYQKGIEYAQDFLANGETASAVRELVLNLYSNAGAIQKEFTQHLSYYQKGIEYAQDFLAKGETASAMHEVVFNLYSNFLTTWYNVSQTSQIIQHLPIFGFWSWVSLSEAKQRELMLQYWHDYLEIPPSPFSDFATACHSFFYHFLLNWHNPQRHHRHAVSTATLAALSESLYGLEQAQENQALKTIYTHLHQLENLPIVQDAKDLSLQHQAAVQQLQAGWQQLNLQPTALDNLATLQQLSWWQKLRQWRTIIQLRDAQRAYHELPQPADLAKNEKWQRTVKRTETALFTWFRNAIQKKLNLSPFGLEDAGEIMLGILFAHSQHGFDNRTNLAATLEKWQHTPPWHQIDTLKVSLGEDWQTWANREQALYSRLDLLKLDKNWAMQRLTIYEGSENFKDPELRAWLRKLAAGNGTELSSQLKHAWQTAQQTAIPIAKLFINLADLDFHEDLFSEPKIDLEYAYAFQCALAMVILGDAPKQIEHALQTWLAQPSPYDADTPILETLASLKQRLTRIVSVYKPSYPPLSETVHNWAKKLLAEKLQDTPNLDDLWQILERTRIGLAGLTMELPPNWDQTFGKELWGALRDSINWLAQEDKDPNETEWPLFTLWLERLEELLRQQSPTAPDCQPHLQHEALVQPFFDSVQQRLRILWLDKTGLSLRDLPDDCALAHLWMAPDSVTEQWTRGYDEWKTQYITGRGRGAVPKDWETVMASTPIQQFAATLKAWATDLSQLTVIFPAPLGQIPWESLPQLEMLLVREVSVKRWLQQKSAPTSPTSENWVACDPSGQEHCMVKEGQWVANRFNVALDQPCPSIYDALKNLKNSRQIHLATHGEYSRQIPTASNLTLNETNRLPLWVISATRTNADLIVLSACESNLSGRDTEGLFSPIGIGPSLAAAGGKAIVGTLWPCEGLAALCFSYHFYHIIARKPNQPWHHTVAEARQALRNMEYQDLETIINELQLEDEEDLCYQKSIEPVIFEREFIYDKKPFEEFTLWAGFTVLG